MRPHGRASHSFQSGAAPPPPGFPSPCPRLLLPWPWIGCAVGDRTPEGRNSRRRGARRRRGRRRQGRTPIKRFPVGFCIFCSLRKCAFRVFSLLRAASAPACAAMSAEMPQAEATGVEEEVCGAAGGGGHWSACAHLHKNKPEAACARNARAVRRACAAALPPIVKPPGRRLTSHCKPPPQPLSRPNRKPQHEIGAQARTLTFLLFHLLSTLSAFGGAIRGACCGQRRRPAGGRAGG